MLDLADKEDFKTAIINMFKELKRTIKIKVWFYWLIKYRNGNLKNDQTEMLELKWLFTYRGTQWN